MMYVKQKNIQEYEIEVVQKSENKQNKVVG